MHSSRWPWLSVSWVLRSVACAARSQLLSQFYIYYKPITWFRDPVGSLKRYQNRKRAAARCPLCAHWLTQDTSIGRLWGIHWIQLTEHRTQFKLHLAITAAIKVNGKCRPLGAHTHTTTHKFYYQPKNLRVSNNNFALPYLSLTLF